ncbi:MAG: transcriptional regulator [Terracidiphilus sp.]|jgi:hypothetical protein
MEFIEAPVFNRYLSEYLGEEDYRALQGKLATNPELGNVLADTGGFRKLRWADPRRGKGRRGGLRIIYYHFASDHQIWLMTLYDKDECSDLTAKEKKALKAVLQQELHARETAQTRRKGKR